MNEEVVTWQNGNTMDIRVRQEASTQILACSLTRYVRLYSPKVTNPIIVTTNKSKRKNADSKGRGLGSGCATG